MTKTDAAVIGLAVNTMLHDAGWTGIRVVLERRDPFASNPEGGTDWVVTVEDAPNDAALAPDEG
jgi:hypothetical protein